MTRREKYKMQSTKQIRRNFRGSEVEVFVKDEVHISFALDEGSLLCSH